MDEGEGSEEEDVFGGELASLIALRELLECGDASTPAEASSAPEGAPVHLLSEQAVQHWKREDSR